MLKIDDEDHDQKSPIDKGESEIEVLRIVIKVQSIVRVYQAEEPAGCQLNERRSYRDRGVAVSTSAP
jgi:hypothetical protein